MPPLFIILCTFACSQLCSPGRLGKRVCMTCRYTAAEQVRNASCRSHAASPAQRGTHWYRCSMNTQCAGGYAWISAADTSLLDIPHCELLLIGAKPDTEGTPPCCGLGASTFFLPYACAGWVPHGATCTQSMPLCVCASPSGSEYVPYLERFAVHSDFACAEVDMQSACAGDGQCFRLSVSACRR